MKNFCMLAVILLSSFFAIGQSNKEDVDMIQSMFGKEKKSLVEAYIVVQPDQKTAFWEMYDKYENDRKGLGKERIALLEEYASKYSTLDDKTASSLMDKNINWKSSYTKMQKKYIGSFSKIIGAVQTAKLFQLEDYLENNIRLFIQESIPFIDELDKSKAKTTGQQ